MGKDLNLLDQDLAVLRAVPRLDQKAETPEQIAKRCTLDQGVVQAALDRLFGEGLIQRRVSGGLSVVVYEISTKGRMLLLEAVLP